MRKLKHLVPEFKKKQIPDERHSYIGPRSLPAASSIRSGFEFEICFVWGLMVRSALRVLKWIKIYTVD